MGVPSTVDMKEARAFLVRRKETRHARLHARFEKTREEVARIVRMLIDGSYAVRIYQWGSLLDEPRFSELSDADIGIEGCPSTEAFFEAYGKAMAMTDLPLHMVEMENIEPLYAERIREKGCKIYDAETGTRRPG